MSHQKPGEVFFPSQDEEIEEGNWLTGSSGMMMTYEVPQIYDDPLNNLWDSPPLSSFSSQYQPHYHHEEICVDDYSNNNNDILMLNNLSTTFDQEAPSSPPFQRARDPVGIVIPCSDNIILHGLDKGQSTSTKTRENIHQGDGGKEGCKQQKRKHSGSEAYNRSNRIRRKFFNEKLKSLQELIPKCNKRKRESILDDATKYIKDLRYQVQLQEQQIMGLTTGAGSPMSLNFPTMNNIMPQLSAGEYLPTFPGMEYGMGIGTGMGMGMGMSYPMINQSGLSNPGNNFFASTNSGLIMHHLPGGIQQSAHLINIIPNSNPGINNTVSEAYFGALL